MNEFIPDRVEIIVITNIRERSVRVRQGLPPESTLRQQAAAISGEAKAIDQEYRQLMFQGLLGQTIASVSRVALAQD